MTTPFARIQNEINHTHLPYVRSIEHREHAVEIRFKGPKGTKHFSTEFRIHLQFPETYPYRPPTMTFLDQASIPLSLRRLKLLHPNVWQVAFQIQDILEGIQYMLKIDA